MVGILILNSNYTSKIVAQGFQIFDSDERRQIKKT